MSLALAEGLFYVGAMLLIVASAIAVAVGWWKP